METQLDREYNERRVALIERTENAVKELWLSRDFRDIGSFLEPAYEVVDAASEAHVDLLNAYFGQRAVAFGGQDHSVPSEWFVRRRLRAGRDTNFLQQALGLLIFRRQQGVPFQVANREAAEQVRTLVRTHLALVGTRAANAWMETYRGQP